MFPYKKYVSFLPKYFDKVLVQIFDQNRPQDFILHDIIARKYAPRFYEHPFFSCEFSFYYNFSEDPCYGPGFKNI